MALASRSTEPHTARSSTRDVRAGAERRFRKIAIEVTATQWWANGDHPEDGVGASVRDNVSGQPYERLEGAVVRLFRHPEVPGDRQCRQCGIVMRDHGWIDTLESGHVVCPGDWIVTGIEGERYPVKPNIFARTYELAADE